MLITTTNRIENSFIVEHLGVVSANVVIGTNIFSDIAASFSDFFGGRSYTYQDKLQLIYKEVISELEYKANELGANCILGLAIDFDEISGSGKSMFMVSACGTAVVLGNDKNNTVYQNNSIGYRQLAIEIKKHKIINTVKEGGQPEVEDWNFITRNRIAEIADNLFEIYLASLSKEHKSDNDTANIENMPIYLQLIDKETAKSVVYKHIHNTGAITIIKKCNLFDSSEIKSLIKNGLPEIAAELLDANKETYSREDINEMISIVEDFNNIPDTGSIESTKDGVFSKEKDMYICKNGHKNNKDQKFCSICVINIKGLNPSQLNKIEEFKLRTSVLSSIFNKI